MNSVVVLQFKQMFAARLVTLSILLPGDGRDIQLQRQEINQFLWRRFVRLQCDSREAE
jgi:hypothetical protein